nr:hypothetical protein Iba_chr07fCG4490 [Ipomoea batatas]
MGVYCLASDLSTVKNASAIKVRVILTYLVMERKGSSEFHEEEVRVLSHCICMNINPELSGCNKSASLESIFLLTAVLSLL